jgi:hypothetical protein
MVLVASRLLPEFTVDSLWSAFLLAFGLAMLNTVVSGLLGINDDDSFYRNVIRWLELRRAPTSELDERGTLIVQIDGLAEAILRDEIETGGLPTLAWLLDQGSHRLARWECDVRSMTSSGQSGILYGNNANIPAFRWYEKSSGRLQLTTDSCACTVPASATLFQEARSTA